MCAVRPAKTSRVAADECSTPGYALRFARRTCQAAGIPEGKLLGALPLQTGRWSPGAPRRDWTTFVSAVKRSAALLVHPRCEGPEILELLSPEATQARCGS